MNKEDRNRVIDMRRAALRAIGYVDGKVQDDLSKEDELLGFAVVRAIEIVGEAASKITLETRQANPQIMWRDIIGMRNRVVHDYLNVDYGIVWQVATVNLPALISQLDELLAKTTDG